MQFLLDFCFCLKLIVWEGEGSMKTNLNSMKLYNVSSKEMGLYKVGSRGASQLGGIF